MITRRILGVAAAATMGAGLLTAAPAMAVSVLYSYSTLDYSYNSSTGKTVYACDRESDSHSVRADWVRTGTSTVSSVTNGGGNGTCQSASLASVVYKHRIVEVVPFANDDEGFWVFPS